MQRRAAAVYVALFLVIAVGAFAYAGSAQSPTITLDDPDYELAEGDEFEINGTTYTVASIGETESEGGHGGGGEAHLEATIEWNTTAEESEEWEPGPDNTVEYNDGDYEVVIPNASDPNQFTLREAPGDDLNVFEDGDGNRVVEVQQDGETRYVPIEEYQGLQRFNFSEGGSIEYDGNNATVGNVSSESVTIEWTAEQTEDVALTEGGTTDQIGDQEYVAHFPDDETLQMTSNLEDYNEQADQQEFFHDRTDGLLMVSFLSAMTGFILLGMAYLPRRE